MGKLTPTAIQFSHLPCNVSQVPRDIAVTRTITVPLAPQHHGEPRMPVTQLARLLQGIDPSNETTKAELQALMAVVQRAQKAKSVFLANISHEIRTPMVGILGAGTLLLDTPLTREQAELAGMMVESSKLLLSIVNDILDVSKMEEGYLKVEMIPTNVNTILCHVSQLLAPKAREKGIDLEFQLLDHERCWIQTDPTRLRQILLNLVGNAVKFTHRGHVHVRATLSPALAPAAHCPAACCYCCDDHRQLAPVILPQACATLPPSTVANPPATTAAMHPTTGISRKQVRTPSQAPASATRLWSLNPSNVTGAMMMPPGSPSPRDGPTGRSEPGASADGGTCVCHDEAWDHEGDAWDLRVDIVDTGIGISPIMLAHVFDRFHQGDDSRTRVYGGSGLGTTISKELAIRLGGDISVTSAEGKGSTFTVHLPVSLAPAPPHPGSEVAGSITPSSPRLSRDVTARDYGITAILAEDNKLNRCIMERLLRTLGISVVAACNGQDVLDLVAQGVEHDLILMDIHMPVCDGVAATKVLRSNLYVRPIVALTANVMECDLQEYLTAGMDATLTKPCMRAQICQVIDRLVVGRTLAGGIPDRAVAVATTINKSSHGSLRPYNMPYETTPGESEAWTRHATSTEASSAHQRSRSGRTSTEYARTCSASHAVAPLVPTLSGQRECQQMPKRRSVTWNSMAPWTRMQEDETASTEWPA
eukprot:jgi/Mesvir1/27833/Mv07511-RA.1